MVRSHTGYCGGSVLLDRSPQRLRSDDSAVEVLFNASGGGGGCRKRSRNFNAREFRASLWRGVRGFVHRAIAGVQMASHLLLRVMLSNTFERTRVRPSRFAFQPLAAQL